MRGEATGVHSGDRRPVVALDGPASSGKSSVGAAVAHALGLRFFDTGLLYRAMARAALDHGVDPVDGPAVAALANGLEIVTAGGQGGASAPGGESRGARIVVDGRDVTDHLRTADVDRVVPAVAAAPQVRAALLVRQRAIAAAGGIVVAGRDIGTVVLPAADVKIWLDATAEERASRRAVERGLDPASAEGREILADLRRRDRVDGGRAVSPSRPAPDAIHVHTDGNAFPDTVTAVLAAIRATLPDAGGPARASGAGQGDRVEGGSSRARPRSASESAAFSVPADHVPWFTRATNAFGRTVLRCFTRVHVEGLEHVPRHGALILASNHISNADAALVACWLTPALGRPVHWMGKAEALEWPIAGWFLRQNGVFGIHRGAADTEAFRLARSVLTDGRVLGTFPEGTRSPTGALQLAKEGVTLLALRTGAPILPIGCAGTDRFWPKGKLLWRPGGHVSLRVGEPFTIERRVGPDGRKESLEEATARLMVRIAELLPERHRGAYASLPRPGNRAADQ